MAAAFRSAVRQWSFGKVARIGRRRRPLLVTIRHDEHCSITASASGPDRLTGRDCVSRPRTRASDCSSAPYSKERQHFRRLLGEAERSDQIAKSARFLRRCATPTAGLVTVNQPIVQKSAEIAAGPIITRFQHARPRIASMRDGVVAIETHADVEMTIRLRFAQIAQLPAPPSLRNKHAVVSTVDGALCKRGRRESESFSRFKKTGSTAP